MAKFIKMEGRESVEMKAKRFRNFLSDSDHSLLLKDYFLYATELKGLTAIGRCSNLSPFDLFEH